MDGLPQLSKLVAPALATFMRKTRVHEQGIRIERTFSGIHMNAKKLASYREYFSFTEALPITYLYLLAQRAQGVLMLDKEYTMPIPGTIHLHNYLEKVASIDSVAPLELEASLQVSHEAEGSLRPTTSITFYQNGRQVAICTSRYLVKRKRRKHKGLVRQKTREVHNETEAPFQEWKLDRSTGKAYAQVSDDHNPIHKSVLAARVVGFKRPIAHGWYVVSRAVAEHRISCHRVEAEFKRPLLLPGKYLSYYSVSGSECSKVLICSADKSILAAVEMSAQEKSL